ncbi:unnamed protein product [Brassica oleracea var. botrytis]
MLLFYLVNDYVNRLKEILGTVPPACCMELPYFHGKATALGDIIGSGRISNRLLSMYLACMVLGLWRCFVVWFLIRPKDSLFWLGESLHEGLSFISVLYHLV